MNSEFTIQDINEITQFNKNKKEINLHSALKKHAFLLKLIDTEYTKELEELLIKSILRYTSLKTCLLRNVNNKILLLEFAKPVRVRFEEMRHANFVLRKIPVRSFADALTYIEAKYYNKF
jgi:hypothetical protein